LSVKSWGNFQTTSNKLISFSNRSELLSILAKKKQIIPRGNGKSYGDSSLNYQIINTLKYNFFISFEQETGIVNCQSGVLLNDILNIFIPQGWFLNVTPGTKFITVGGAIASDVHGKNHHLAGTFSNFVLSFNLAMPDGSVLQCSRTKNKTLFHATCGGMGLMGVILDAKIQLRRIPSALMEQMTIKTRNLEETLQVFEHYKHASYSVAWIDCLTRKKSLGRGLFMLGEHADAGGYDFQQKRKLTIPINFPSFSFNFFSAKLFNMLYYYKAHSSCSKQKISIDSFFYPLDRINHWNRLYGKNGLIQYQFVLPKNNSLLGMRAVLNKISDAKKLGFLAVLKLFGKSNQNYLSFPTEGYTLAIDFKREPELFPLLEQLDKIVVEYGGRIYLAKDCRISKKVFEQGYPDIQLFRDIRKKYHLSDCLSSFQSQRIDI
jgi:FAD/FMN-containing dehydrogenase